MYAHDAYSFIRADRRRFGHVCPSFLPYSAQVLSYAVVHRAVNVPVSPSFSYSSPRAMLCPRPTSCINIPDFE